MGYSGLLETPVSGKRAGRGGGQHGLPETLENEGDAVETFAAGVYPCEHCVELVGDALLLR